MKKGIVITLLLLCTGFSFAQQTADPAEGFWLGVDNKGVPQSGWEIYQSNGLLFAKMLSAAGWAASDIAVKCKDAYRDFPISGKVNEMPVLGTTWIFGLQREESGHWINGFVIDPSNGTVYKCRIIYHPADGKKYKTETLEMRGEIGLGIGGSQNWQRATREQASVLR
jgi:uncharacterized protein (DUF2147 family)